MEKCDSVNKIKINIIHKKFFSLRGA